MPIERLDIGRGPEQSRLARLWTRLPAGARRGVVALLAVGMSVGAVLVTVTQHDHLVHRAPATPHRTGHELGPPPWAVKPRLARLRNFELVNRSGRRLFVSTPPRFVFTVPPHRSLQFRRAPVCHYQRFTARFRHGPPLGTISHFCSASRWVVPRSGPARLVPRGRAR